MPVVDPPDKNQTAMRTQTPTDGIVNQHGIVCPSCRGAGEMMIGPRMDNCPRCDGYRYIVLFWPRREALNV
jgi:DnaJ-class molecular chaperone